MLFSASHRFITAHYVGGALFSRDQVASVALKDERAAACTKGRSGPLRRVFRMDCVVVGLVYSYMYQTMLSYTTSEQEKAVMRDWRGLELVVLAKGSAEGDRKPGGGS